MTVRIIEETVTAADLQVGDMVALPHDEVGRVAKVTASSSQWYEITVTVALDCGPRTEFTRYRYEFDLGIGVSPNAQLSEANPTTTS